jgi:tripartite-type tricarboxylate transporter receptor subunit TctC
LTPSPGPVAQALQEKLRQPFVIDYRQGANSRIGTAYVAEIQT